MFQSKDGRKFGSAFVAKRRDAEKEKAEGVMSDAHEAKETPEFEAGEKEGMQEPGEGNVAEDKAHHGPALSTHVHSDHTANTHHLIGHHKDGHVHHSKHGSAQEAHNAAAELAAASDQPSGSSSGEAAPEADGFQMPKLA